VTDDRDDPLPSNVLPFVIPKPETEEEKKAKVDRMLALFPPLEEAAKPPENQPKGENDGPGDESPR
jgi:hypothetical protein